MTSQPPTPEGGAFGNKRLASKYQVKSKGEQASAAFCKPEGNVAASGFLGSAFHFLYKSIPQLPGK